MVNQRLPSEARHRNTPFPYPWQTACTLSHSFRQLGQAEYDRLSLDEKLAYLQMLMGDIREKTDETKRAIEARRDKVDKE